MESSFNPKEGRYTAFFDGELVVEGTKSDVHRELSNRKLQEALIFEDWSGKQIDFDLTQPQVEEGAAGPGRPKLGVKPREVTLLPRHWEWLDMQRGGASAYLRQLVESDMKEKPDWQRVRNSQDSCFRFMNSMAGNLEGYEDACRGLTRKELRQFEEAIKNWPNAIRGYATYLAAEAFVSNDKSSS